ncbi:hypothetical protein VTJ04DRAFT_3130 [Mycothermus thermophilus]|uniref:uncharacterized protein n=1 Tax=Humicola insolens TaxID=85995 RepID=UPI003743B873
MIRQRAHNYVCWRCLATRPVDVVPLRPRNAASFSTSSTTSPSVATCRTTPRPARLRLLSQTLSPYGQTSIRSASTDAATTITTTTAAPPPPSPPGSKGNWGDHFKSLQHQEHVSLRERLRQWEIENPHPVLSMPTDLPSDGASLPGRSRADFGWHIDLTSGEQHDAHGFDDIDMVDIGLESAVLNPGDLVEVTTSAWRHRLLAICLGRFNGHLHFYTHTGKWFTCRTFRTNFVIKSFIKDPEELQAVIDAIPSVSSSATVLNELQDLNLGPSRDVGAALIRRMYKFQSEARLIHQTYVERLSRARSQMGSEEKLLSLRDLAEALLPASLKRGKNAYPPEAMYAVHSVIEEEDIAFRALHRAPRFHESHTYLLYSADIQETISRVEKLVRNYYEYKSQPTRHRKSEQLTRIETFTQFLKDAQQVIDLSRSRRDWSPHGMLGLRKKDAPPPDPSKIPSWSDIGLDVIRFIEHWAVSGGFRPGSNYHGIGAAILRLLDRYEDAILDSTTGWTFLQEIGWLPPWDISARHEMRLPEQEVRRHVAAPKNNDLPLSLSEDRLADLRQDFARSTVYCIDSVDTVDVDDGISLEDAGGGKYWIHVHVADPASRLSPDSDLAKQAAAKSQSSYLAGFQQAMLDHPGIRETFSLGPNSPTLTFSALVDEEGHLLDGKISPGTIRDVVYITPEEVATVVEDAGYQNVPPGVLEVGTPPASNPPPPKPQTRPEDLSRAQKRELKTLFKLAHALQRNRVERGAFPAYPSKPKATVSLNQVSKEIDAGDSIFYDGDPHIRVAYEPSGSVLVSSLMQLAGEVGARWCYERDIPIPYRVQLLTNEESLEALRKFSRDVMSPQLSAKKNPPREHWEQMMQLVGGFTLTTSPGPNMVMGLDLYTKVTSPLRRYPDLLTHWQIEAALLHEHRTGQSLVFRVAPGSSTVVPENAADPTAGAKHRSPSALLREKAKRDQAFLPFDRKQLESHILPSLRIRERHSRIVDNSDGNNQWILQALVRAWKFNDVTPGCPPLPQTFLYKVTDVPSLRFLSGELNWFERRAEVDLQDFNGVVRIADVQPGDVFEVELKDVNVHEKKIYVRLLKIVSQVPRENKEEEKNKKSDVEVA